ncbi:hypothetical protein GAMM_40067 [Gammaproteobacteria bacterium]
MEAPIVDHKIPNALLLRKAQDRARSYAELAYAMNGTDLAFRQRSVSPMLFRKYHKKIQDENPVEGTPIDMWTVFNIVFQKRREKLKFDEYGEATVAVDVNGKILQVHLREVKDRPGEYDVQLQRFYEETTVVEVPTLGKPKKKSTTEIKLSEPFTGVIRIQRKKTKEKDDLFVAIDPQTGLKIVKGQRVDRNYQAKAALATVGMTMDEKTGKIMPIIDTEGQPVPVKYPQLIVAGTGAGKSGMLFTSAMIHGRGIFTTIGGNTTLVDEMVDEANKFIKTEDGKGNAVEKFPDKLGLEEAAEYLKQHPYVVMSHDQLILYAPILKEQHIFIDEAHSIVPRSFDQSVEAERRRVVLKEIVDNNMVLGVTATPTIQLEELLGKRICDITLYEAQNTLKTVRQVDVEDRLVKKEDLVKAAVSKLLTRSTEVLSGMKGCSADPTKNTILGSQTQGIIFTDDPATAKKIHDLLISLSLDPKKSENAEFLTALNKEASRNRAGSGNKHTKSLAKKSDVYREATDAQHKMIEYSVKIDIITNLAGVTSNKEKLQEYLRDRNFAMLDKIYARAKERHQKLMLDPKERIQEFHRRMVLEVGKDKETKDNPTVNEYYRLVEEYFRLSMLPTTLVNTKLLENVTRALGRMSAISTLLINPKDKKEEAEAKFLLDKKLTLYVVSSGSLSVGYSNKDIMNEVMVQEHSIFENLCNDQNPAMTNTQKAGRDVRDEKRRSIETMLINDEIPVGERNLTLGQIFDKNATQIYMDKTNQVDEYLRQTQIKQVITVAEIKQDADLEPEMIVQKVDESESGEENLLSDIDEEYQKLEDEEDLLRGMDQDQVVDEENLLEGIGQDQVVDEEYIQQILNSKKEVDIASADLQKVVSVLQGFRVDILKAKGEIDVEAQRIIMDQSIALYNSCEKTLIETLKTHMVSLEQFGQYFSKQKERISDPSLDKALVETDFVLESLNKTGYDLEQLRQEQKERREQIQTALELQQKQQRELMEQKEFNLLQEKIAQQKQKDLELLQLAQQRELQEKEDLERQLVQQRALQEQKDLELQLVQQRKQLQQAREKIGGINTGTIQLLENSITNLEKMKKTVDEYLQSNAGYFWRAVDFVFHGWRYQRVQEQQKIISAFLQDDMLKKATITKDITADSLDEKALSELSGKKSLEKSKLEVELHETVDKLKTDVEKEGLEIEESKGFKM